MKISVIIPAYNRERFIARTIESVLAQTVTDWELIIVDDGSSDATPDIARAYASRDRRIRVVSQANAGVGAARNRGLREAGFVARYITFLDSDDLWEKDALERLLSALEHHPHSPAASGLSRIIDTEGELRDPGELEIWGRRRQGVVGHRLAAWPAAAPTTLAVLAYDNCIYTPGQVLIRRSALAAAGPFDPAVSPCDDWDMWLRLSLLGPIAYLDRVVLNWRRHGTGESMRKEEIRRAQAQIRRRLPSVPGLSPAQRRIILAANRLCDRRVCSIRLQRARSLLGHAEVRAAWKQAGYLLRDWGNRLRGVPLADPPLWPTVAELYRPLMVGPPEASRPLQLLCRLARSCRHVTELGTGAGFATTALLAARPQALVSYDRGRLPRISLLEAAAREAGTTRFGFHRADPASIEIDETDLLLIGHWSTPHDLRHLLDRHGPRARHYIAVCTAPTAAWNGGPPAPLGADTALADFLHRNPDWRPGPSGFNTHGLATLARQPLTAPVRAPAAGPIPYRGR